MYHLAIVALAIGALGLHNGDLKQHVGGKPVAWELAGDVTYLPDGGPNGLPAIELRCAGKGTSSAVQVLRPSPARRGSFAVTTWIRCDEVGDVGDSCLWLDIIQKDGTPIWGIQGLPNRSRRDWQQVRAEVYPPKPVSEVRVYLILRNVKGRVRFGDVRVQDIPLRIEDFRVYPSGEVCEVRARLSEAATWTVRAGHRGNEIWSQSGEGSHISARFPSPNTENVTVTLDVRLNNQSLLKTARVDLSKPRPAVDWWVADSFTRVFQDDLPPAKPLRSVRLDMARGERESFQICLRPSASPLRAVTITTEPTAPDGQFDISWQRVGYVFVEYPFAHPYATRKTSAWWPDPLLPPVKFDVEQGTVQPLWFTVHVPRHARPGTFTRRVLIRGEGMQSLEIPVSVTIHPAVIPVQPKIKTAFALMDGHLEKVYGRITPELRRAYTDLLLEHHLNPDNISRTRLPDLRELDYANPRGLNAFNILNVVPEPDQPVLWVPFAPAEAYTPEFKRRFFERLDAFVPELQKRGLLDKAYIYGFDERGPEYNSIIKDLFGAIKERYPRIHTLSTAWPEPGTDPLSLNIDWYVSLTSSYDETLARHVRKHGGEWWWYVCCGPNYPYANWLIENPLVEARLIWWQAFQNDVEGFLYWGLNIWERSNNDRPIPENAGPRLDWSITTGGDWKTLNGDGVLLYPGVSGPIGSMRLANIRDGIEDTELLRMYSDRFGSNAVGQIVRRVTAHRTCYSREPSDLLSARLSVLRALK